MIVTLGAGYILREENLGHEGGVIQFHADVSKMIPHGGIFLHPPGGRDHVVDDPVVGLVVTDGILQPCGKSVHSKILPGNR